MLNDSHNDYQGFTVAKSPLNDGPNKIRSYSTMGHNTPTFSSSPKAYDTTSGTNESRNDI